MKKIDEATALKEGEYLVSHLNKDTLLYDEFFRYIEIYVEPGAERKYKLFISLSHEKEWKYRTGNESQQITMEEMEQIKKNITEAMKFQKVNFEFE